VEQPRLIIRITRFLTTVYRCTALMRILRDSSRPGSRHCHDLRGLLPALWAAPARHNSAASWPT